MTAWILFILILAADGALPDSSIVTARRPVAVDRIALEFDSEAACRAAGANIAASIRPPGDFSVYVTYSCSKDGEWK